MTEHPPDGQTAAARLDYLVEATNMRPVRYFSPDELEITHSYDVVASDCFDRDQDLPDLGKRVAVVTDDTDDTVIRGTVVDICYLVEVERDAEPACLQPRCDLAPDDHRHGTVGGYTNHHCRCPKCRGAAIDAARRRQQLPCRQCGEPCWAGTKGATVRSGLCRKCANIAKQTAEHGTESRYKRGCRCRPCRDAAALARRQRRSRVAA